MKKTRKRWVVLCKVVFHFMDGHVSRVVKREKRVIYDNLHSRYVDVCGLRVRLRCLLGVPVYEVHYDQVRSANGGTDLVRRK